MNTAPKPLIANQTFCAGDADHDGLDDRADPPAGVVAPNPSFGGQATKGDRLASGADERAL